MSAPSDYSPELMFRDETTRAREEDGDTGYAATKMPTAEEWYREVERKRRIDGAINSNFDLLRPVVQVFGQSHQLEGQENESVETCDIASYQCLGSGVKLKTDHCSILSVPIPLLQNGHTIKTCNFNPRIRTRAARISRVAIKPSLESASDNGGHGKNDAYLTT